jgi:hypothetical protein
MIKIENLKESDKGRSVTYTDGVGDKEFGHITSWNQRFIFVDYGHSGDQGGIATDPKDLMWG